MENMLDVVIERLRVSGLEIIRFNFYFCWLLVRGLGKNFLGSDFLSYKKIWFDSE